jgi:hypothetical protein
VHVGSHYFTQQHQQCIWEAVLQLQQLPKWAAISSAAVAVQVPSHSFSSSSSRASGRLFLRQQQQHQGKWSPVPSPAAASEQVIACYFGSSS